MSAWVDRPAESAVVSRWLRGALIAGAVGLVTCLVAVFIPDLQAQVFRSWLVAFNLCLGVALGGMVVVMLQYLTGGNWGFVLRRPLEASTRTLPLLALLFVPLLFGLSELYPWANPDKVKADEDLLHKAPYFYYPGVDFSKESDSPFPWFFMVRAVIYFAIWNVLQVFLNRWSKQHDETNDPQLIARCQGLSAGGLLLYALTITFASIDWVMSLEPKWYSTIYGAMFGMGQVLSGFAFGIVVFLLLGIRSPNDAACNRGALRDLGSLLLAFVMVWAYLSFDQFLLIWAGNLPEEVSWYIPRAEGPWKYVALSLILFLFALPFVLLLSADLKRNRRGLAAVACLIVGMRLVELFWLIVPAFHDRPEPENPTPLFAAVLVDIAAVVGIGGVWLGLYLWQLQRLPLLPVHPPEGETNHGQAAHH